MTASASEAAPSGTEAVQGPAGSGVVRPRVVLVAGMAADRTIGRDGRIPWHYTEDMRAFKAATLGTALVMGRKTLESIGRLLPGRTTVVLTRSPAAVAERWPGAVVVDTLDAALAAVAERGIAVASICGGGEIYALALPLADELLLTFVPAPGGGPVYFPEWDASAWREVSRETIERVERRRYLRR